MPGTQSRLNPGNPMRAGARCLSACPQWQNPPVLRKWVRGNSGRGRPYGNCDSSVMRKHHQALCRNRICSRFLDDEERRLPAFRNPDPRLCLDGGKCAAGGVHAPGRTRAFSLQIKSYRQPAKGHSRRRPSDTCRKCPAGYISGNCLNGPKGCATIAVQGRFP